MKKLATFTSVLALATVLGAFSPAMANKPVGACTIMKTPDRSQ
jgi:hypothetical protein